MHHYWRLIRPGLLAMVLFSMAMAAWTAGPEPPPWSRLGPALFGTAMLIAGAVAMNQRRERDVDAAMPRTVGRPLPSRGLSVRAVTRFAIGCTVMGLVGLAVLVDMTLAFLGAASWGLYVLVYTPLKRRSLWQTPVGAVAGAIPMLLGAAAADALWTPMALVLFGIVFFWQFPHTMAIAWRYRDQFDAGAILVAPVADPSGRLAGWLALGGAAGLVIVSLIPAWLVSVPWPYVAVASVLGMFHLAVAIRFMNCPDDASARFLGRVGMVHLPVLLAFFLWAVR